VSGKGLNDYNMLYKFIKYNNYFNLDHMVVSSTPLKSSPEQQEGVELCV